MTTAEIIICIVFGWILYALFGALAVICMQELICRCKRRNLAISAMFILWPLALLFFGLFLPFAIIWDAKRDMDKKPSAVYIDPAIIFCVKQLEKARNRKRNETNRRGAGVPER